MVVFRVVNTSIYSTNIQGFCYLGVVLNSGESRNSLTIEDTLLNCKIDKGLRWKVITRSHIFLLRIIKQHLSFILVRGDC